MFVTAKDASSGIAYGCPPQPRVTRITDVAFAKVPGEEASDAQPSAQLAERV
jgi:hypothetical protein